MASTRQVSTIFWNTMMIPCQMTAVVAETLAKTRGGELCGWYEDWLRWCIWAPKYVGCIPLGRISYLPCKNSCTYGTRFLEFFCYAHMRTHGTCCCAACKEKYSTFVPGACKVGKEVYSKFFAHVTCTPNVGVPLRIYHMYMQQLGKFQVKNVSRKFTVVAQAFSPSQASPPSLHPMRNHHKIWSLRKPQ